MSVAQGTRPIIDVKYTFENTVRRGGTAGVTLFRFLNLRMEKPRYLRQDIEVQSITKYDRKRGRYRIFNRIFAKVMPMYKLLLKTYEKPTSQTYEKLTKTFINSIRKDIKKNIVLNIGTSVGKRVNNAKFTKNK